MASSIASFVPDPIEKWAEDLASPKSTMLPFVQRWLRIIGKERQSERLVSTGWPCMNHPKILSISRADSASLKRSRPARMKVSGSVSKTQVEAPASYW
jgi:hypothetical protein